MRAQAVEWANSEREEHEGEGWRFSASSDPLTATVSTRPLVDRTPPAEDTRLALAETWKRRSLGTVAAGSSRHVSRASDHRGDLVADRRDLDAISVPPPRHGHYLDGCVPCTSEYVFCSFASIAARPNAGAAASFARSLSRFSLRCRRRWMSAGCRLPLMMMILRAVFYLRPAGSVVEL